MKLHLSVSSSDRAMGSTVLAGEDVGPESPLGRRSRYRSARRTTFQQIDASLLAEVVDLIGALPGQTVLLSRPRGRQISRGCV